MAAKEASIMFERKHVAFALTLAALTLVFSTPPVLAEESCQQVDQEVTITWSCENDRCYYTSVTVTIYTCGTGTVREEYTTTETADGTVWYRTYNGGYHSGGYGYGPGPTSPSLATETGYDDGCDAACNG
jgi:hypothetical protein